jgi:hypothetical protein
MIKKRLPSEVSFAPAIKNKVLTSVPSKQATGQAGRVWVFDNDTFEHGKIGTLVQNVQQMQIWNGFYFYF